MTRKEALAIYADHDELDTYDPDCNHVKLRRAHAALEVKHGLELRELRHEAQAPRRSALLRV